MLYANNISLTTVVGSSITLSCNVRPELNLTFAWYFQGSKVSTGVLQNGALSIPSVSVSQDGTYTCLVSNQLGYAQEFVTLTVQGRYSEEGKEEEEVWSGGGGGRGGCGGERVGEEGAVLKEEGMERVGIGKEMH